MLRLVLAAALAVALVAAVTPALDDARATRTERLAGRELDRVGAAAASLAREESPGARRTLDLSLPTGSPTAAPLTFVALGGLPDGESTASDAAGRDVLAFRVAGGRRHVRRVAVDLRVVRDGRISEDDRTIVLRSGGSYAVTLRLVRSDGRRIVVVSVGSSGEL
ncbi:MULTISPECIES: hypothetical protein [Halorussus]|uniref:DUF7311 family protein n=1 Tax=Halorussus TaxID=1070314 RepID=UPI000E21289D|nr:MULTISPECIES: hypothetical protein [Halorussus]NHN58071.1 hypothetical protein [Halorussus sp. JP-T4]